MDHDFLEGIDEHFNRLVELQDNGKSNGKSRGKVKDRFLAELVHAVDPLSPKEEREVLNFIRSLNQREQQSK